MATLHQIGDPLRVFALFPNLASMANRSLHLPGSFCLSSGTVTLDLVHARVLIVCWRKTGEYFLPKGRKDIGETIEQAALRETFEETGHNVELLPTGIKTLATLPASKGENENIGLTTEPVAVQQRVSNGILKIVFWFAASGDSTEEQKEKPHKEDEEFDAVWVHAADVPTTLSWEHDIKITEEVLRAAKSEGLLSSV